VRLPATSPGDVLSYGEMCQIEGAHLQRGMNFRLRGGLSVVLMSVQPNTPYADALEDEGRTLIYEGHSAPLSLDCSHPDELDQPARLPSGRLGQNGLFHEVAERFKRGEEVAELVKVYEKLRSGIWIFNGTFRLTTHGKRNRASAACGSFASNWLKKRREKRSMRPLWLSCRA